MPTEEIECPVRHGRPTRSPFEDLAYCGVCHRKLTEPAGMYAPAPGSLTAARLRLADAAEAWAAKWLAPAACRDQDEWDAMLESAVKLAALRTARGA